MMGWPASRPKPVGLTAEWYRYLAKGELRFQQCRTCSAWRHPPRLLCDRCGSADWAWERSSGRGRVFTWTVTHKALHPGFAHVVPYPIVVAELDEGVRLLANVRDLSGGLLSIDLPVEVAIEPIDDEVGQVYFRLLPNG